MDRDEIVQILEEMATLLELKGENPFRVRAYRNGARALLNINEDLEQLVVEETLTKIKGIGAHLAKKISELVTTGRLPEYEKLKRSLPKNLLDLLKVRGLGPKKVKELYQKLKIHSIPSLKKAAKAGKIAKLKGFGKKGEQKILDALEESATHQSRHLWWHARRLAEPILDGLKKLKSVKQAQIAGSLRRKLETIGDLDFLASSSNPKAVMDWFTTQSFVKKVLSKGDKKSSILLQDGIQADLRVVPNSQFAYAQHYFIGSKEHNIALRERALKRGWSLSEYGIEVVKKGAAAPIGKIDTEEKLFKLFGLSYIPPELRENMGEFEAAAKGKIPSLIETKDLRGALHNHTAASDGRASLKEMIQAAEDLKWEYIGITDHSKSSVQANGLSEERLLEQIAEIRKIKSKIRVFSGLECDILPNGKLDFSDSLLKKLDYVVVSIHSSFQLDEKKMTQRLIKAIEHPSSTIIGHLTGRLLLKRKGYALNVTKVIDACIANKKIIELNANPQRLDMDWRYWRAAADKGLLCCINPDAHAPSQLAYVDAGIQIARKGWLEKKHVINTLPLKKMEALLKKMHP